MASSPLYVPAHRIRPLAPVMRGIACSLCNRRQSLWECTQTVQDQGGTPLCSLCFLYHSPWAEEQETGNLDAFIAAVEAHMGKLFVRADDSSLEDCGDADRILSSLVTTTRMFDLRAKVS